MNNADMIWLTHNKRKVRVGDMNTAHLRNAIAMIEREVPEHYLLPERNAVPVYAAMKGELAERTKPRIVEAKGTDPALGRYRVQWKVEDGQLFVRHTRAGRYHPRYNSAYDIGWGEWRPTTTLTRAVLAQLITLYDSPTKENVRQQEKKR